ncbi:carbohydrate-binding family 9-like protein [Agriterribacter sp.]|uniref:carbohydrate-binding family 9-like protein n=1 Tax=Agriterribacter sp. TaxID=2821509 RepID=UPI002C60C977|nr:carbohydrate-binding family 9-like protein [Agriterribacter sp.]HRO47531.1 carbohydrate-binding family 9-like protein [Agriterribacter sp.]HRQ17011.1 carbohydrate-binding family 9-like protein [Agriterribacter sp.]
MKTYTLFLIIFSCCNVFAQQPGHAADPLLVKRCNDFTITGKGENAEWQKTNWVTLHQIDDGKQYESKYKVLYSSKGIYVLFSGEDEKITSTFENDFDNLFNADVFEVFFHPDPSTPLYFEYEISPLNKELVLLIPNLKGGAYGWTPWHYSGERKVKKSVHIEGGAMEPGSAIRSWSAELFFPYSLLSPLSNIPPKSGTIWNANFCRLDYDSGRMIKWSWSPVERSFHEFKKFRSMRFE